MFHVSLLKPHQGNPIAESTPLPPTSLDNHPIIQAAAIIDLRNLPNGSTQVLVQRQGLPTEETWWETPTELSESYPSLHLRQGVCPRDEILQPSMT